MNRPARSSRTLRNVLIILLILIGAAALILIQYYKGIIKKQLPEIVAKSSKHTYKCTLSDVSINLLTRKVTFYDFRIWYDSTQTPDTSIADRYQAIVPEFSIGGISISGLLWGNILSCTDVLIQRPEVRVIHNDSLSGTAGQQDTADSKDPFIKAVRIGTIRLNHLRLQYAVTGRQPVTYKVADASLLFKDVEWQPADTTRDTTRILYARQLESTIAGISYLKKGALYDISLDTVHLRTADHYVELKGLSVLPAVSKKDFYKAIGHEKDLFRVWFGQVVLREFNFQQLLQQKRITADTMLLNDGIVNVYFSRLPKDDPKSKMGKFPSQLLLRLPLKVSVPYTRVRNGAASYTEVSEETELPGALLFSALHGHVSNITNDSAVIAAKAHCILDLQGRFMKSSPVKARFDFLLTDTTGVFVVDGMLENISGPQITDAALALGKVAVDHVDVQQLALHVAGDQYHADGQITFLYRDLAIDVKKIDKETKEVKDKPLLSFLANKFLLFPHNPMPGKEVRRITTHISRDPHKSFFNLIWRNIFDGVKMTAVRNQGIIKAFGKKKKK